MACLLRPIVWLGLAVSFALFSPLKRQLSISLCSCFRGWSRTLLFLCAPPTDPYVFLPRSALSCFVRLAGSSTYDIICMFSSFLSHGPFAMSRVCWLMAMQFFTNKNSADSISEMLKYDQHGSFLEFMQNAMMKGEHEEYDGDKVSLFCGSHFCVCGCRCCLAADSKRWHRLDGRRTMPCVARHMR